VSISSWRRLACALAVVGLGALALLVTPAAGAADSAPSAAKSPAPSGWLVHPYFYTTADDPNQSLTATYDPNVTNGRWVVVIHGGSWTSGSANDPQALAAVDVLSRNGYQVFDINYRLIADTDPGEPAVSWPDQKQDVLDAISWVRAHAATFGLNPNRGAVWGFSAGGHLATVAGLSGNGDNGIRAIVSVDGVVQPQRLWLDIAGVYPAEPPTAHMQALAGWAAVAAACPYGAQKGTCAARWKAFDPASYTSPHDPAVMVFSGLADTWVPYQMAESLTHSLDSAQIPNYLVLVPKLQHDVRTALDGGTRQAEMLRFLDRRTAVDVPPTTSHVTATAASTSLTNAQSTRVTVHVTSTNTTNGGSVEITSGAFRVIDAVKSAAVTATLPAMSPGTHTVAIKYLGTALTQTATTSVKLTVTRVVPVISTTTNPTKLQAGKTRGKYLVLTVRAAAGSTGSATMTVRTGNTVVGRSKVSAGRSVIKLPSLGAGVHNWTAQFSGTSTVAPATRAVQIRVLN
jgi:acetyl esterase/lipase